MDFWVNGQKGSNGQIRNPCRDMRHINTFHDPFEAFMSGFLAAIDGMNSLRSRTSAPNGMVLKLAWIPIGFDMDSIYLFGAAFRLGFDMMAPLDGSFFVRHCMDLWEQNRTLRRLARHKKMVVRDVDEGCIISPTLGNLRFNHALLSGYTKLMAAKGVIITKRMSFIKPPIREFYREYDVDVSTEESKAFIHGVAHIVKRMLGMIKRKWSKWELPRVSRLYKGPWPW